MQDSAQKIAGGGGHSKKVLTGTLVKFDKLLFVGVVQNEGYYWEVEKIGITFWVNWKFALFFGAAEKMNYRINP